MDLGDVNARPRRWTDSTTRARVVEGWHPSAPDQVGYNLLIDGRWIGTYPDLDETRDVAAKLLPHVAQSAPESFVLVPVIGPGA